MGIFGWSYPPGCSGTPFDEDHPCDVCGEFEDTCICPECTQCGAIGDTRCYTPGHHVQAMTRSAEQKYCMAWNEAHWENDNRDESRYYHTGEPMNLKIYEYTKPGFDGGTDKTDHMVQWVAAPSEAIADAHAKAQGWEAWGEVQIDAPQDDESLKLAGVDVVLRYAGEN